MNCSRVEKLMPLYVESDLSFELASRVETHLEDCGRCCALAGEYKESQNWLRSTEPPAFDDAFFDELKRGVLKGVAGAGTRSSVLASLSSHWSRRQVLALAAAILMVFGAVALYFYQARTSGRPAISQELAQTPNEETDRLREPNAAVGTEKAPRASFKATRHVRRVARSRSPHLLREQQIVAEKITSSPSGAGSPNDSEVDSRPILRIEFQTRDPNIRIIWFAPSQTDSHQSKPATD